ncbi:MAG: YpdA family putative bacillithiol disulfide reductase [Terriglobales bacterium]
MGDSANNVWDLAIVGGGPTGLACAIEAQKAGLRAVVLEKGCVVNSIYNYPTQMVFFTTPELLEIGQVPMTTAGAKPTRMEALEYYRKVAAHYRLNLHAYEIVDAVEAGARGGSRFRLRTTRRTGEGAEHWAENVVLATGYYDLYNHLKIPGEERANVLHYYKEAHPYTGLKVAVIGGKNSAVDAALDLYRHGAHVTLIHRHPELSPSIKYWVRPDIENRLKAGQIAARMDHEVLEIFPSAVKIRRRGAQETELLEADFVFALVGYHPDYEFLRAAGVNFEPKTGRPVCDPVCYETETPGLYLGGVVIAGPNTGEIFIENGRFHGQVIVADILQKRAAVALAGAPA